MSDVYCAAADSKLLQKVKEQTKGRRLTLCDLKFVVLHLKIGHASVGVTTLANSRNAGSVRSGHIGIIAADMRVKCSVTSAVTPQHWSGAPET